MHTSASLPGTLDRLQLYLERTANRLCGAKANALSIFIPRRSSNVNVLLAAVGCILLDLLIFC